MDVLLWALVPPALIAALSLLGAVAYEVWHGVVRPRRVPREEIERCCAELRARHGTEASDVARREAWLAWRADDTFEEARWRRIGRRLDLDERPGTRTG